MAGCGRAHRIHRLAGTELNSNPFHVLGATPRDDRHRILELAEERSLTADADVCRQARADLMNPRNRLAAELAWLPEPAPLEGEEELPAMVHANLSAARWDSLNPDEPPAGVAAFLCETADILRRVSVAAVLRDINSDRAVSGFPGIASERQLQEELSARLAEIGSIVNAAL